MTPTGKSSVTALRGRPPPIRPAAAGDVRVLVVDDSLTVRTVFERLLERADGFVMVGSVSSAEAALDRLRSLAVDVILLDLEMPGMGGLQALPKMLAMAGSAQILVVSAMTADGANTSVTALTMGAADTMLKPQSGGFTPEYRASLLQKIGALGDHNSAPREAEAKNAPPSRKLVPICGRSEALLIGASTGGIHALSQFMQALPTHIDQPIFVTQHLPRGFMPVFARQLGAAAHRDAILAEPGTMVRPGQIHIAPGDGHMTLEAQRGAVVCGSSQDRMPSGCTPSVDPMFTSAARVYDGRVTGILLSGMGRDGVDGARCIFDAGGTILAQDAASCAVWGMPGAAVKSGIARCVDTPANLARYIARSVGGA